MYLKKESTFTQWLCWLICIIIIIAIGYCFLSGNGSTSGIGTSNSNKNRLSNGVEYGIEGFNDGNTNISDGIQRRIASIDDKNAASLIGEYIQSLQQTLTRYNNLETPIVLDDNGNICNLWNNYGNGQFSNQQNICQPFSTGTGDGNGGEGKTYKCLNSGGSLNSCNNIYRDGFIHQQNTIQTDKLLDNATNSIIDNLEGIQKQVMNMNKDADYIINKYGDLKSIELQQKDIIQNNMANLADKQSILKNNQKNLMGKQVDTNNNQNNFNLIRDSINNRESWNNLYYKIFIGLIILIAILAILNFLFSNILD